MSKEHTWIKRPRLYTPPVYDEYRVRIITTTYTHNRPTMTQTTVEMWTAGELIHTVMHRTALYGNRPPVIASYWEGIKAFNFYRTKRFAPPTKRIVLEIGDLPSFLGWSRQRARMSRIERRFRGRAMRMPRLLAAENPQLLFQVELAPASYLHALEEFIEDTRQNMKIVPYYEDIFGHDVFCAKLRQERETNELWQKTSTSPV